MLSRVKVMFSVDMWAVLLLRNNINGKSLSHLSNIEVLTLNVYTRGCMKKTLSTIKLSNFS